MDERAERTYGSEGEFEADRRRMAADGWVVRRRETLPDSQERTGIVDPGVDAGGTASGLGLILNLVLVVGSGFLQFFTRRRSRRFVVTYGRDEG